MSTKYFTFGQSHTHSFNGKTLDKDTLVEITCDNPRDRMFEFFGDKWAMQYDKLPDKQFYKEIVKV